MPRRQRRSQFSLAVFLTLAIVVMGGVWLWLSQVPLEPPSELVSERLPDSALEGEDVLP